MNGRDNAKLEQRRLKSYYIRIVTEIPKTGGFSKPNGIRRRHNCFNSFFLLVAVNLKYAGPGKHLWGKPGCSLVLARTDAHRFYFLPLKEAIQLFAVIFSIHCLRPQVSLVLKSPCFCVLRDRPRHRRRIRCSFRGAQIGECLPAFERISHSRNFSDNSNLWKCF